MSSGGRLFAFINKGELLRLELLYRLLLLSSAKDNISLEGVSEFISTTGSGMFKAISFWGMEGSVVSNSVLEHSDLINRFRAN